MYILSIFFKVVEGSFRLFFYKLYYTVFLNPFKIHNTTESGINVYLVSGK